MYFSDYVIDIMKRILMKTLLRTLFFCFTTAVLTIFNVGVAFASSPLVSVDWLSKNLQDPELVIIDLRNSLDGGGHETFM